MIESDELAIKAELNNLIFESQENNKKFIVPKYILKTQNKFLNATEIYWKNLYLLFGHKTLSARAEQTRIDDIAEENNVRSERAMAVINIHAERKRGKKWDSYLFPDCISRGKNKEQMEISGVYVIIQYKSNKVIYVGQSKNIYHRLSDHNRSKVFKRFNYLKVKIRKDRGRYERLTLEAKLIERLKPSKNKKI